MNPPKVTSPDTLPNLSFDLVDAPAQEVLEYAFDQFHPSLYFACSFQKEASVILDMALKINPKARFFTLDTGVLFPETRKTWIAIEQRYGVSIDVVDVVDFLPEGEEHRRGDDNPWAFNGEGCCRDYKVQAIRGVLDTVDAWVTGLRRDQADTRAATRKIQWDNRNGLWKINPIADWSDRDVWDYISKHDVPYNELHDKGYESIGCMPCTQPGEGRAGRWANSERTECGLHG